MGKWRYGVVLDAGSSGTRVHVYRWLRNAAARKQAHVKELKSLPEIKTKEKWTKKIHPGVSSFANRPELVGSDHLAQLLDHAKGIIPAEDAKDTPIFLLATAGMRLLGNLERQLLLDQICSYARDNSDFLLPDCGVHIQVIPGVTEGLYGWIATNYLMGSFDAPEKHDHGKGHNTYGFLDMGGASAQIAFAPNVTETEKHAEDLKLLRLRNIDGSVQEHRVFVTSWLEFGVHEARRRYLDALQTAIGPDIKELPDPCLPSGLRTALDGKAISAIETETYLLGTGKFDECLRQTFPLLDKDAPCADEPCLLNGIHVPAIDFDVNHFIGISEYWHTTHEIFEMGYKDKAYDFNTYQERVQMFCSQDWDSIEYGLEQHKWGKKVDHQKAHEVCFKASWIINMLHDGIGVPRVGLEDTTGSSHNGTKEVLAHGKEKGYLDAFQAVNKIDSTEVSWTLGKIVLYASSQVPLEIEEGLPVGFGSNAPGIPADFQYPSVQLLPDSDSFHSEHWHDALFDGDSPRRIPGFVLFMLIVVMAGFFLCGRSRRSRIFNRVSNVLRRGGPSHPNHPKKRKGLKSMLPFISRSSPSYERVLEDGVPDYELGAIESDGSEDGGRLSEADSARLEPPKRASSWGSNTNTPSFKYALDNSSTGTIGLGISGGGGGSGIAMDRAGLVVRTESRDHLAPIALGPTTNGRRSRAGSPTRSHQKSPSMTPLADD
ncbi:Nucleoside phosphatase GDA1/CD39 [Penicillium expansum]|uniref:Nucleoside phosphatase GDA1/CD39 n=1 Tax=Penicillium expansum TaxID=27334 RepID=A0A0A2J3W3_PENEN|nr:Nucleoside phosphatase GDA1/CD39 [Penicillium expansum]KGO43866.1 Nucleoside phosphatase GDA1/CD39 [Penicillium expansum]KGO50019.1 Nucleoside phosphatase GDA1/CD39 [Penicillium expansum]KGO52169.1 Nucleoside phosphatase GDA1/CD39 [Penicillium expansum]